MKDFCSYESQLLQGVKSRNIPADGDVYGRAQLRNTLSRFTCKTMWAWYEPISPHLAAAREGSTVPDTMVVEAIQRSLQALSSSRKTSGHREDAGDCAEKWAILETAGGVASPGPSGSLQCDMYRY